MQLQEILFCNKIFNLKNKLYIASGSPPPPPRPRKNLIAHLTEFEEEAIKMAVGFGADCIQLAQDVLVLYGQIL
jgi:hypothetical protein